MGDQDARDTSHLFEDIDEGGAPPPVIREDDAIDPADRDGTEPAPWTPRTAPIRWSRQRGAIAAALAAAQARIEPADKDRENTHLRSRYSTLLGVREVARIPLAEAGIAVVSGVEIEPRTITVETSLVHASGQWCATRVVLPIEYMKGLNSAQIIGVLTTYGRRYGLTALTGVVVREDEDDDDAAGLDAQGGPPQQGRASAPKVDMPRTLDEFARLAESLPTSDELRELHRMSRHLPFAAPPKLIAPIVAKISERAAALRAAEVRSASAEAGDAGAGTSGADAARAAIAKANRKDGAR